MSLSSPTSACSSSRCYSSGLSFPIGFGSNPINVGLVCYPKRYSIAARKFVVACSSSSSDPLLVKAAKGQAISRPPAWMMRQAGSLGKHSDQTVSSFSLTSSPLYLHSVGEHAAVLGFVGAPWTIATYIVEGGTTRTYTVIKNMCHTAPDVLRALLSHLTKAITEYVVYQVEHGAHCIQIFDSWGGQLTPEMWERWSKPYIEEIIHAVKKRCPDTPIVFYINGNGGLLERMKGTGADVIGLDWTVDMADGRRRLGSEVSVQGNVDPAYLFSPLPALTEEIERVVKCAGPKGHILNLGHGVLVGTPEEAVAHFFETARNLDYQTLFQNHVPAEKAEPELVV
ncbi:unnamed protein product [Arabidopsis thaliana]|uniref:uroporphyrinogen decarboxylase n=1 Tax=Arabidopsis thaliana TaxID=3702 RepID=A0A7G2EP72_ARATH|nr:unnamed protein product [Arabidopsis thaliana]